MLSRCEGLSWHQRGPCADPDLEASDTEEGEWAEQCPRVGLGDVHSMATADFSQRNPCLQLVSMTPTEPQPNGPRESFLFPDTAEVGPLGSSSGNRDVRALRGTGCGPLEPAHTESRQCIAPQLCLRRHHVSSMNWPRWKYVRHRIGKHCKSEWFSFAF